MSFFADVCLLVKGTYLVPKKFTSHIKRWEVHWLQDSDFFFFSSFLIVLLCPKPWVPWQFQTRTKKTKKALLLSSMETQLDLVLNQLRLCRNHQQIMVSLFRHIFQSMYQNMCIYRYVRPGGTFSNQGGHDYVVGIICSHD